MKPAIDRTTFQRLIALATDLHDEALVCAKAGAYRAGCVTIGSAFEGMLLATAFVMEPELRAQAKWPAGDPLRWDLGTLLKLALDAGWLEQNAPATPGRSVDLNQAALGDAARWVQWLRNLIHPGAFVREMPPGVEFGEPAFQNAYAVLDAAFSVAGDVLDRAMAEGIWSPKTE